MESPKVEALAHKTGMSLVSCRIDAPKPASLIAEALDWLWQQGEAPSISHQAFLGGSGVLLTQIVKTTVAAEYAEQLTRVAKARGGRCEVERRQDGLAVISVVGHGFQQSPETVRAACDALAHAPRHLETSNTQITVCVEEAHVKDALAGLHQALIERTS